MLSRAEKQKAQALKEEDEDDSSLVGFANRKNVVKGDRKGVVYKKNKGGAQSQSQAPVAPAKEQHFLSEKFQSLVQGAHKGAGAA